MATQPHSKLRVVASVVALYICSTLSIAENGNVPRNDSFPKGLQGNITQGRAVFEQNCMRCHGPQGDGKGADAKKLDLKPLNFQTASFRAEFGRRDIFTSTALGKLGTHMPTWLKSMDDQDVADVSEYIYQRFVLKQIDLTY